MREPDYPATLKHLRGTWLYVLKFWIYLNVYHRPEAGLQQVHAGLACVGAQLLREWDYPATLKHLRGTWCYVLQFWIYLNLCYRPEAGRQQVHAGFACVGAQLLREWDYPATLKYLRGTWCYVLKFWIYLNLCYRPEAGLQQFRVGTR